MVRQCAWCLRLIDDAGERVSPSPLPKLYEASHGMCGICGTRWMEQVLGSPGIFDLCVWSGGDELLEECSQVSQAEDQRSTIQVVTDFVLQLQKREAERSQAAFSQRDDPMRIL